MTDLIITNISDVTLEVIQNEKWEGTPDHTPIRVTKATLENSGRIKRWRVSTGRCYRNW